MKYLHYLPCFVISVFDKYKGFVYFCRHIDKMSEEDIAAHHNNILENEVLCKFFGLEYTKRELTRTFKVK